MPKNYKRESTIKNFILKNIEHHESDIVQFTMKKFKLSRPSIMNYINKLANEDMIQITGKTRDRKYSLKPLVKFEKIYNLNENLSEDLIWRQDLSPHMQNFPDNVKDILNYCSTEMINNAIDHSSGKKLYINLSITATCCNIIIQDDGIGIFKKIKEELNLLDEKHAVLELSKGKLTTDSQNHTGEGIFFSSRMTDDFYINSGQTWFTHNFEEDYDWIMDRHKISSGTFILMKLKTDIKRTTSEIFQKFAAEDDDYRFTKTIVPVKLAQYGNEMLVSRSQAKRLLARIDKFNTVIFDFSDIKEIGQAFADQIFRVFLRNHPEMRLVHINASKQVEKMILRAYSN